MYFHKVIDCSSVKIYIIKNIISSPGSQIFKDKKIFAERGVVRGISIIFNYNLVNDLIVTQTQNVFIHLNQG